MNNTPSPQLIKKLQATIHTILSPLVTSMKNFALLDFPDHGNVGDSAIWLGELAYFSHYRHMRPSYVSDIHHFSASALEIAVPDGPIFIHGGGNFGDVWPIHQHFREEILARFSDRKIIQLPQTLHFSSTKALERSAAIINAHPDFTLLVRDDRSLALAKSVYSCQIELCPDMAFCLGSLAKPQPAYRPLLLLMRTDHERCEEQLHTMPAIPKGAAMIDWLQDEVGLYRHIHRRTRLQAVSQLGIGCLSRNRRRQLYYRNLAAARVKRGLMLLSSAEHVITDRLHAHILCMLLDISHIILDNNYGKISSFFTSWTNESIITSHHSNLATALESY